MKRFSIALVVVILIFTSCKSQNQSQNIKVMTYNIRLDVASDGENVWPNRKDFLSSQVLFYSPDIMGIQEARPNQMTDLKTALKDYKTIGIGRDGDSKGEYSAIFYNTKKFKVEKESTFWLSETPNDVSKGWDAAYPRICTYGLFTDLKSSKKIWVFNAHLDHVGEEARTKGIELILSKITSLNTKNYPVIFMGDFNSEPDSERIIALKKVMNDSRDISETKPFGPSGTFNGFKYDEPVTKLIDYIFISNNIKFKVKKYAILSDSKNLKYPSDHFPVYVKLKYN